LHAQVRKSSSGQMDIARIASHAISRLAEVILVSCKQKVITVLDRFFTSLYEIVTPSSSFDSSTVTPSGFGGN
jgi:hypothetical protein